MTNKNMAFGPIRINMYNCTGTKLVLHFQIIFCQWLVKLSLGFFNIFWNPKKKLFKKNSVGRFVQKRSMYLLSIFYIWQCFWEFKYHLAYTVLHTNCYMAARVCCWSTYWYESVTSQQRDQQINMMTFQRSTGWKEAIYPAVGSKFKYEACL